MRTFFLLLFASVLCAEQGPTPRVVDQYGDPLPTGAVARFGTSRWRVPEEIVTLQPAPDGKSTFALAKRGVYQLDARGGVERRVDFGPASIQVLLAPDNKTAYTLLLDGAMTRWDVATGEKRSTFTKRNLTRLAISADSKLLAAEAVDAEPQLLVFDTSTGRLKHTVDMKGRSSYQQMAFTPDGKQLVAFARPNVVEIITLADGKRTHEVKVVGNLENESVIYPIQFTPAGDQFVVFMEGRCYQGTVATGRVDLIDQVELPAHEGYAFTPDGKHLAVATGDDVQLLSWPKLSSVKKLESTGTKAHYFSADNRTLWLSKGRVVQRWDTQEGKQLGTEVGHNSDFINVEFAPDGKTLLTMDERGEMRLWNPNGQLVNSRWAKTFYKVQYSADGQALFAVDISGVQRLHPQSLKLLDNAGLPGGITSIHMAPQRQLFAYTDEGYQPHLWSWATKADVLPIMSAENARCVPVGFGTAGRQLLGHIVDPVDQKSETACVIWSCATGKEWRRLPYDRPGDKYPHAGQPHTIITSDGRTALLDAKEGNVRVWDLLTGGLRWQWRAGSAAHLDMAIAPDLRTFVIATEGQPLRFFRLGDKEPFATLTTGPLTNQKVPKIVFAPEGKTFATCHADMTVLLWRTPEAPAVTPTKRPFAELWADLLRDDAIAFKAMLALESRPEFIADFHTHMKPAVVDAKAIAGHLANLDADRYAVREQATQALQKIGTVAVPAIRDALRKNPSPEARERLEALLKSYEESELNISGETLRHVRVLEILEHWATPEARKLLASLAEGTYEPRVTEDAKETLHRLKYR